MFKSKYKLAFVLSLMACAGVLTEASARPNVGQNGNNNGLKVGQMKTTASCKPATAAIDLDINNIRARLMTGGDMWWDQGGTTDARYEVPKGSRKNSLFAGSVWIGGIDQQGQLKVAAQTYRQSGNDYWPGPLDDAANIDAATCNEWDRFWKINKETINRFRELGNKASALDDPEYEVIKTWPAKGNPNAIGKSRNPLNIPDNKDYAPFVDIDQNGIYTPEGGDYPGDPETENLPGDQYIWWVFNDKGNVKGESGTEGIGIEVQASAFAFAAQTALNDMTFYNYRLINRGNVTLDSTFISTWTDADLGDYRDDFIGCDTSRGLGILYNGKSIDGDGGVAHYGEKVPMVGVDFFRGPKRFDTATKTYVEMKMEAFTYYNNDFSIIGNPRNGAHIYGYMTGTITNGEPFTYDFNGPNVPSKAYENGPATKFVFTGEPGKPDWNECTCNNVPADRRFVHSSGPFKLEPGVVNDITIGAVWVSDVGGCPNTSFRKIRAADDLAQALFINKFEAIEGPEAPKMTAREMDRKIIFYLTNPPISTNYGEKFGRDTGKKYRVSAITTKSVDPVDSLYKFEGYRVFQLKNKEVQPAQIFNEDGEVNTELAVEVFQTDIKNGVTRIINYKKETDISDSTYVPQVKVTGKDSGIQHSFVITQDQFATGANKSLVNYRNYYFVAIAYAHNEFAPFNINNIDSSQDVSYIESAHGAGGIPIPVVVAMPNPANGDMGTVLNADYGDGVIIKRLEGAGNGGNTLAMTEASEMAALAGPDYAVATPEYKPGNGPVKVKVIDPVRVKPHDWELFIEGTTSIDASRGLNLSSTWKLVNLTDGNVIYSESDLSIPNEQILEHYGISVELEQVKRPGDDQVNGNGYITSSITFKDPSMAWLAGTQDAEGRNPFNWIRSGAFEDTFSACDYNDYKLDTIGQFYENMLANLTQTRGTWAPYALGAHGTRTNGTINSACGFGVTKRGTNTNLYLLPSVEVVLTSDKTKWTRCIVLEMSDDAGLAEGGVPKFELRKHAGWTGEVDANGAPVYSTNPDDTGMSWFPGYAINQETGERLNIVFGEDSWLRAHGGGDMIWNPSSEDIIQVSQDENTSARIFGGKHYIYVAGTKYDECAKFRQSLITGTTPQKNAEVFRNFMWVGNPLLAENQKLLPLSQGLIPTETRISIRVTRPYINYAPVGVTLRDRGDQAGNPLYSFSTKGLAPTTLSDNGDADKQALLDRINVVPNPYLGYTGYEANRLDTRVRIINLPRRATVSIYSLDGALIRRLEKDNPNVAYIDWDIRNLKGLPVASGMYLMHVNAEGIGETVLRWFGAMRPTDINQY